MVRENKSDKWKKEKRELVRKNWPCDEDGVLVVWESDDGGVNIGARESDQGFREERENEKFYWGKRKKKERKKSRCKAHPKKGIYPLFTLVENVIFVTPYYCIAFIS